MKDCRNCQYINPNLSAHCLKLGRILDDDEIFNDEPCEFYINKWEWLKNKKPNVVDLCGRLPYGVKVKLENNHRLFQLLMLHPRNNAAMIGHLFEGGDIDESYVALRVCISDLKPYLRPMSSMTEKERNEYLSIKMQETERVALAEVERPEAISIVLDWLNRKMFDYRGLIEKGLALVSPEGMYKMEE